MSASSSQASTNPLSSSESDDDSLESLSMMTDQSSVSKRPRLGDSFEDDNVDDYFEFDQDEETTRFVERMILKECPLTMVDDDGFKSLAASIRPLLKMPSQKEFMMEALMIYEHEKVNTMALLQRNKGRIAVGTAMWGTRNKKRSFMAITAHFVDDSWILQNRLLSFVDVPVPHTPEVLANALKDCILQCNIESKLSTLAVDSCIDGNDAMIEILWSSDTLFFGRELSNMRSFARVLNLIVNDGLDVVSESIE